MKVLVTGGAGYIGAHAVIQLLENDYEVVILDNFSNSSKENLEKIKNITGKSFEFYEGDVGNYDLLSKIFTTHPIHSVLHFAGYKAVGESVKEPLKYYDNNIVSTIQLLKVMQKYHCKNLVFSSSATVYGNPEVLPLVEDARLSVTNPYGRTKLMIEEILHDLVYSDATWHIVILRYFNPIGAHFSGLIYENPKGIPNNLMPYIIQVANQEVDELKVFGGDYRTPDGTGVRDFIHVDDLALGHLKALKYLENHAGIEVFNLGTGHGYSVLDLVKTFEEVNHIKIPYQIVSRREGDIDACYADVSKAREILHFEATKGLSEMCEDSYRPFKK